MASGRFNLSKASVLAVDDSMQVMEILSQILLGLGVGAASKCGSAQQAREALSREAFDLAIIDDRMPDEDGYSLTRWIRADPLGRNFTVPIVLVSANPTEAAVVKARDCGANLVLAKPIVPGVLLGRMDWMARNSRAFVNADTYRGPDRRFHNRPLPDDVSERRLDALRLIAAPDRTLSQDEVNFLFD